MATLGNTPRPAYVYDTETDTWVPIGVGAHTHDYIPNALVDAKGDILTATADNTPARLAIGTDNYYLQADSSQSTGLKWGGAWQAWTPTVANLTKGNGTEVARYTRIGNTIHFYYKFVFGSTSSMGTGPTITLPVNSYGSEFQVPMNIQDYGTANIFGYTHVASNIIYLYALLANGTYGGAALVTGTAPMTWTTNDGFTIWGSYEAA